MLEVDHIKDKNGHNQLEWAKVRKRAILQKSTQKDWEEADDWQRQVMHQIELAIISVTEDGPLEDDAL